MLYDYKAQQFDECVVSDRCCMTAKGNDLMSVLCVTGVVVVRLQSAVI